MRRKRNRLIVVMLASAQLAAACDNNFTPGARIESPRILALRADEPFAHPGEEVALELLVANPQGAALRWAFGTCTLPPSSAARDCISNLDGELMPFQPELADADANVALRVQVPHAVLDGVQDGARAAQPPSALIGVVIVACRGDLAPGTTLDLPLRCLDPTGRARAIDEIEVGVKRIFVRERDRNANPTITALTWDGEPWDESHIPRALACTKRTFDFEECGAALRHGIGVQTSAPEAGANEYGGAFEEQMIVQFYSTHGLFRDPVRIAQAAATEWVAQTREGQVDGDEGEIATLWMVVRDDRGGVAWAVRRVQLSAVR